jgi:hypothetical protein
VSVLRFLLVLGAVMLVGGAAWIVFLSLYNVAILNLSTKLPASLLGI